MDYLVTFSDDSTGSRRHDKVGHYPNINEARQAAKAKVETYFGKKLSDDKALVFEASIDLEYVGAEDWFVASLAKKDSKAVIVSINYLPLTRTGFKGERKLLPSDVDKIEPVNDLMKA